MKKNKSLYQDMVKAYKGVNIPDIYTIADVDLDTCPEYVRAELQNAGYDIEDESCISLSYADINRYEIPYDAVDHLNSWIDEEEQEWTIKQFMKPAEHYLVVANNVRWDGATGYKLANGLLDALYRDYDTNISPLAVTRGGKSLVCREASHDVPMGALTYIIALTQKEYENAQYALRWGEFGWLTNFAKKNVASVDQEWLEKSTTHDPKGSELEG